MRIKPAYNNYTISDYTGYREKISNHVTQQEISQNKGNNIQCGQHFYMDFGFMQGSGFGNKDLNGQILTSINRFRSYKL
jgi:hypothetical protein